MEKDKSFLLGSLVIAAGSTLMGTSVFRHQVIGASVGVTLFPVGYSIMAKKGWEGVDTAARNLAYAIGILSGSLIVSAGLVAGAQATQTLSINGMMFSGVAVIVGYFLAHESYIRGFMA